MYQIMFCVWGFYAKLFNFCNYVIKGKLAQLSVPVPELGGCFTCWVGQSIFLLAGLSKR